MTFLSSIQIEQILQRGDYKKKIAILPVGCVEQHGPFLPIETDSLIASSISAAVSSRFAESNFCWCYVFPEIHYSPTKSNAHYPGTVSVEEDAFRYYLKRILISIMDTSFDMLVIMNAHGPADISIREIEFNLMHDQFQKKSNVLIPVISVSLADESKLLEDEFHIKGGKHADWREFILLYAILGEQYFTDEVITHMNNFQNQNNFEIFNYGVIGIPMEYRTVQGVIGNPIPFTGNSRDFKVFSIKVWNFLINSIAQKILNQIKAFDQFKETLK